jgi:hypothetical protein
MVTRAERSRSTDRTEYPVEERVGEDILQRWIVELFRPLLERYMRLRDVKAFVGADQFIYYRQYDSTKRVAPDVYVLPDLAPDTHVTSWKVWETGVAPTFALEVVSKDWEKDYAEAPGHYDHVGVKELLIFDPSFKRRARGEGLLFQIYRRVPRRGFVRVEVSNEDRVRSKVLGCWLRAVGSGRMMRLRIGLGHDGDALLPTGEEQARLAEEQARLAEEQARLAEEQARLAEEQARLEARLERTEKEQALARVAELERELRARGDGTSRPGKGKARRKR